MSRSKKPKLNMHATIVADLAKSGLTVHDCANLQLKFFNETETQELTGKFFAEAYQIPYFDLDGAPLKFFRLKLFNHEPKYWQPPSTMPRLYLPPVLKTTWGKVADNAAQPVYFTEGEKKAACVSKYVGPCIGLGGVWSWKSKKAQLPTIVDFTLFRWAARPVTIVFDSDAVENPNVYGAMHAFARELTKLGADVKYISLPADDGKVGVDDFITTHGSKKFGELPLNIFDDLAQLTELNNEFAIIRELNFVYDLTAKKLISARDFLAVRTANKKVAIVNAKGALEEKYVGKLWLDWPFRREHSRLSYSPGAPLVLPTGALNIWDAPNITPTRGDVSCWRRLLDHFFGDKIKERKWFEAWCAYPLVHPGTKMYSAVLFWGDQGAGKTLLAVTLGRIYGKNFAEVQRRELFSQYNEWSINKQFILVEEATGSDKREDSDLLKHLITRQQIRVSEKYVPNYFVEDRANYFFTSNHPDALFLDPTDRRFFIWQVPSQLLPFKFFKEYDKWYHSDKGIAALYYYLTNEVDVSNFDPAAPATETEYKVHMQDLSASDLDLWCRQLVAHPEEILTDRPTQELFTTEELHGMYCFQRDKTTSLIALSKALRRARIPPPRSVTLPSGHTKRLVAIKNQQHWVTVSSLEWAKHYAAVTLRSTATPLENKKKYQ